MGHDQPLDPGTFPMFKVPSLPVRPGTLVDRMLLADLANRLPVHVPVRGWDSLTIVDLGGMDTMSESQWPCYAD